MKHIGVHFKIRREELQITQELLCKKAGISIPTLAKLERLGHGKEATKHEIAKHLNAEYKCNIQETLKY